MSKELDKMMSQAYEYCEDGNFSEALKLYDLALKQDPKNINVIIDKGVTLQNLGRIKQAINIMTRHYQLIQKTSTPW
ncbi:M48 family metallopeptidase [Nitrosarchaeum sp. AC2]|uniref:tetratricopeptide repeat protein n=1 Tax=Nitrosarchaeum sp. AC2 TaxID=2259673 RepID=UPI00210506C3|nr:tetratricopeptide repeat protein [Nitrosarchaeum sp. AC2]